MGHEALAPDLPAGPAADLDACAAAVAAAAAGHRDIVVAGHSLGCFIAPLAADRMAPSARARLSHDPRAGGVGRGVVGRHGVGGGAPATRACRRMPMTTGTSSMTSRRSGSRRAVATPSGRARAGCGRPWPPAAWPGIPTRVVLAQDDRFFPAPFVRRLARERLGVVADEIRGGHLPALARPEELAALLVTLAQP